MRTPMEATFPRQVRIKSTDDEALRERLNVRSDVTVPDREVTSTDTALVKVHLQTTGDGESQLAYEQEHCDRNEWRAKSGEFGLFLFPVDGEWTREGADCPVVSYPDLSCGIPVVEETLTVPAAGSLTWEYRVVVPPGNLDRGGCVVPGSYRFRRSFTRAGKAAGLEFVLSVGDS